MITLAESELGIPILIDELDSNPWLLNVNNGTINLKTGELQRHDPKDFISRIIPLDYHPKAKSLVWQEFLGKIFQNKNDLISYIQRALGYSITGVQSEGFLFLPWRGVEWQIYTFGCCH